MKGKKKIKHLKKENLRDLFTEGLDIPTEVVSDLPIIMLTGNKEINIENFNNLLEYTQQRIRLNTKSGILIIDGCELEAKNMTAEKICIKGNILHIAFVV